MDVKSYSCLDGAKKATGVAVVIDVFRASNTIIACLNKGAEYILPVGDLNDAYKLKEERPDHLLFGERDGLPPKGFDYGNSPAETLKLDLLGKKIILTTSAGSQGIVNAVNAEEILIGSFGNASAIVNYIKKVNPKNVSLLAMGNNAREIATEDEECASYIKSLLENKTKQDMKKIRSRMLASDGANRLRRLNQEDDLKICLEVDTYNIVPIFNRKSKKIISCNS